LALDFVVPAEGIVADSQEVLAKSGRSWQSRRSLLQAPVKPGRYATWKPISPAIGVLGNE